MALISTYGIDPNITGDDKWIGTDFNTGYTKNFSPTNLANFFNISNSIGIAGQFSFRYYSSFLTTRPEESITTSTPSPAFSSITSVKIHKNSGGGNYCLDYINYIVGKQIIITDSANADIFGHFTFVSITQDVSEPNFYNLTLTYIGGNGSFQHNHVYSISKYSSGSTTIPSLDQVLYVGYTGTGKNISLTLEGDGLDNFGGSITLTDNSIGNNGSTGQLTTASVILQDNNQGLTITSGNLYYSLSSGGNSTVSFEAIPAGIYRNIVIPNASGTLALTSQIPSLGGYVPTSRTLTINGTTYDLTANRSWSVGDLLSSGSYANPSWITSLAYSKLTGSPTIPTVGTWGALNYPTWTSGTPFVKMTAAGTFALDTNAYVPYSSYGTNNVSANNFFDGFTSIAASSTLITLTVNSTPSYLITGSGGQTIKLPNATTLPNGTTFEFNNNQSSGAILVNNNSNTLVKSVPSGGYLNLVLIDNSIAAGSWDTHFQAPSNVSWSTNTFDYAGSITSATWNGVSIADNRIASAATWNAKQNASTRRNANNSTNSNINYCGVALGTGVSDSSAVWTITRLTIASSGSITTATATNVAWTNRETAIYT